MDDRYYKQYLANYVIGGSPASPNGDQQIKEAASEQTMYRLMNAAHRLHWLDQRYGRDENGGRSLLHTSRVVISREQQNRDAVPHLQSL